MSPRLDAELPSRGLARSRTQAARLIAEGRVSVDGRPVRKPSAPVADAARITVAAVDHYVSRAAHKLIAALDAFDLDVSGRLALDLGASTGGFTQVLRERGAAPVIALDVGHGQLDPQIAADPQVTLVEGVNARELTPSAWRELSGTSRAPEVVTADLSFISLSLVLPAIAALLAEDTATVLLIKPQFEVGRSGIREGLVTDPGLRADAVAGVLWAAWDAGLSTQGLIASPLLGTHGNAEFLVRLGKGRSDPGNPTEWLSTVNRLTGAA